MSRLVVAKPSQVNAEAITAARFPDGWVPPVSPAHHTRL
jgi:hypothetical protein